MEVGPIKRREGRRKGQVGRRVGIVGEERGQTREADVIAQPPLAPASPDTSVGVAVNPGSALHMEANPHVQMAIP